MTILRLLPTFTLLAATAAPVGAFADEAAMPTKAEAQAQAGAKAKEDYGTLITPGENTAPSRVEVVSADVVDVRVDESMLESTVALTAPLADEEGRLTTLQGLAAGRPVVLQFGYYRCPVVCPQVLGNLVRQTAAAGIAPGRDYAVVFLSLDPNETKADAAPTRAKTLAGLQPEAREGWTFATAGKDAIASLAASCGYHYAYLARANQFVHPDVLVVLSPKGRIARFLPGSSFTGAQLAEAVAAAKAERSVRPAEATFWGKCFDRVSMGAPKAKALMMAGGALMLALMAGAFLLLRRIERRRQAAQT